jgi:NMD protein affecting ribosome stability and mRNA decay
MPHFVPPLLPPFKRGPCPKCGAEAMRLRWCDASSARRVRGELCPDADWDHMHLTCPICAYCAVCAPLHPTPKSQ